MSNKYIIKPDDSQETTNPASLPVNHKGEPMVLKAFAIHDTKSKAYQMPFFKHTIGEAERDLKTAVNSQTENNLSKYPEDFDLFYIGDYDDQEGKFIPLPTPQHVVKALSLKAQ